MPVQAPWGTDSNEGEDEEGYDDRDPEAEWRKRRPFCIAAPLMEKLEQAQLRAPKKAEVDHLVDVLDRIAVAAGRLRRILEEIKIAEAVD